MNNDTSDSNPISEIYRKVASSVESNELFDKNDVGHEKGGGHDRDTHDRGFEKDNGHDRNTFDKHN